MLNAIISITLPFLIVIFLVWGFGTTYERMKTRDEVMIEKVMEEGFTIDDELANARYRKGLAKIDYYVQAGKEKLIEETKRAALYYRDD